MASAKHRKAINFDLDTHALKEYYPKPDYRGAYKDLKAFFSKHGFTHRQGSGYVSERALTTADIFDLADMLAGECPWMGRCVKRIDVTNIGQQHDLSYLFEPAEGIDVPPL